MKISPFKKITVESFPKDGQQTAAILADILNPTLESLASVMSKNITIADNIAASLVTVKATTNRDMTPTTTLSIKTNLNTRVQGCVCVNIQDITSISSPSYTITNISAATPTTITTSLAHGFETGDIVNIGGSNSTPNIDGSYKIVAISPTQFQIPLTVSGSGSSGNVSYSLRQYAQRLPVVTYTEKTNGLLTINTISGIPANTTYQLTLLLF